MSASLPPVERTDLFTETPFGKDHGIGAGQGRRCAPILPGLPVEDLAITFAPQRAGGPPGRVAGGKALLRHLHHGPAPIGLSVRPPSSTRPV